MDALRQQVQVVSEELAAVKGEIINLKAAHAGLHQTTVDANQTTGRTITEIASKVEDIETKMPFAGSGFQKKPLLEPKQVEVDKFAGGPGEHRSKFLEWVETFKDRVTLYDPELAEIMTKIERNKTSIDHEQSVELGVTKQMNRELQGFIKDRTKGLAGALVRGNKT